MAVIKFDPQISDIKNIHTNHKITGSLSSKHESQESVSTFDSEITRLFRGLKIDTNSLLNFLFYKFFLRDLSSDLVLIQLGLRSGDNRVIDLF